MLIGIFSDVHDNLENLKRTLLFFNSRQISTLIFCGDFCSPIPARLMGAFEGEIHCVFGNGDGDRFTISKFANNEFKNLKLHGEHAELNFGNAKIAVTHYPLYGKALASTGDYNAVFSGHTHEKSEERINDCLWVNPGEIMGWKGTPTCAIYNTETNAVDFFEI
ncbi:metallophosphoesterase [Pedobacter frigiditerrae]|uniref:Phosphoesterase n=1 Tax=Pedobacter frigiditerrae TaxID=2530452 RepID=A0A4R0N1K7_9SPHI|nr:metallophosphoesterase [Pedobacter frigiditerrae]TCC93698.1 metallophosphoesterase [Pedobacter frigiditerrae]